MRSTVSVTVDLSFVSFSPLSVNATGLERSVIYVQCVFLTLYLLFKSHRTCLHSRQHNRPLPSNEGCGLPFTVIEGSLAGVAGYGNARGDPCCGRPVRCVRRCDIVVIDNRVDNPTSTTHIDTPTSTTRVHHPCQQPPCQSTTSATSLAAPLIRQRQVL